MARAARKPPFARTAYLKKTLVFYDGPQVALMQSDRGFPMIAVAVGEPSFESYPMFITEVTDTNLRRYLREKVDLRFLFKEGAKRHYIANWAELDEKHWLKIARADDVNEESYFPRHGFWARHHTADVGDEAFAADRLASFAIDGSWEASDFSQFYGKVADLYAYLAITSTKKDGAKSALAIDPVKDIIRRSSWRGGGSYVGFYDAVFSRVDTVSPLGVNCIAYASPGMIELKGSSEPLSDVSKVVDNFGADDGGLLKAAYDEVYGTLGKEKLRTASPDHSFSSEQVRHEVLDSCYVINSGLGVDDPEELLALCDYNALVFAKITLSFYRRAKDLYAFHAEGRVTARGLSKIED